MVLSESTVPRARSTDHDKLTANKLTANQRFRHSDFVAVILSQSKGLGKMALGIVKYAYDRSSQLIDVIWFAVTCRGPIVPTSGYSIFRARLMIQVSDIV